MISTYGQKDPNPVKKLGYLVSKRIRFEGFIQFDLKDLYYDVCSSREWC
jgi:NADPH-dependent curcumin reductase CurA